jgi:predicted NBD/HSP70 family sugar kinase
MPCGWKCYLIQSVLALSLIKSVIGKSIRPILARFHAFWTRADNLIDAAQHGDALALQLRSRFAHGLGIAVSSTAQLFSANMIVIGGVATQFGGKEALDTAQLAVQQLTILHKQFGLTKVAASKLSPDSATIGAATLVIEAIMDGQITAITE